MVLHQIPAAIIIFVFLSAKKCIMFVQIMYNIMNWYRDDNSYLPSQWNGT